MPLKTHHDEMPNLNLTSLIDVVFLLIVFFITSSRFTDAKRDVDLKLPTVADGEQLSVAPKARTVAVHADGRLTLDGESVTLEELTQRLAESITGPQQSVVILGDGAGPFQHVAAAMAACKAAGVSDLGVSVEITAAASGGVRR
jgi:biopolymer transport protein ExbD